MSTLTDKPETSFQRWYKKQGEIQNKRLFDRLAAGESMEARLNLSKILAYLLASLVHGVTLIFVIVGIVALPAVLASSSGICCTSVGLALLAMAWLLRPRNAKLPDDVLDRVKFPTLFQSVDQIAAALSTSSADYIVIDERFNASWGMYTWRRKGLLTLGLPLWEELAPAERVALVAHEFAHKRHGDSERGWFIGGASTTLIQWYILFYPSRPHMYGGNNPILSLILLIPANIAWYSAFLLHYLLLYDSRRAEYLADYQAASIAGTEGAMGLLKKLKSRPFRPQELPGLEATHPPLDFRIDMLRKKPPQSAQIVPDEAKTKQMDAETQTMVEPIKKKLRERKGYR